MLETTIFTVIININVSMIIITTSDSFVVF